MNLRLPLVMPACCPHAAGASLPSVAICCLLYNIYTHSAQWSWAWINRAQAAGLVQALAQGFVPDSRRAQLTKEVVETVKVVLERLVGLLSPDDESEAFDGIG